MSLKLLNYYSSIMLYASNDQFAQNYSSIIVVSLVNISQHGISDWLKNNLHHLSELLCSIIMLKLYMYMYTVFVYIQVYCGW